MCMCVCVLLHQTSAFLHRRCHCQSPCAAPGHAPYWTGYFEEPFILTSSALTLERKGAWQNPGIRPAGNFRFIFLSSTYSSRLFSYGDSKMYCMACCKFLADCINWLSYWQILLLLKTTQSLPWSAAVKKYILAVIPWQEVTLKSSKPV